MTSVDQKEIVMAKMEGNLQRVGQLRTELNIHISAINDLFNAVSELEQEVRIFDESVVIDDHDLHKKYYDSCRYNYPFI